METKEQNPKKKKKSKKTKKEKDKEKQKEKIDQQPDDNSIQNTVTRSERAISYLRLWNSDKKSWKFNKMHQIHLLHIMYDDAVVSIVHSACILFLNLPICLNYVQLCIFLLSSCLFSMILFIASFY